MSISPSDKAQLTAYDEVFDGRAPRPAYREVWARYAKSGSAIRKARAARASLAFDGDAPVLDFPRVLTRAEYRRVAGGVAQRGRAIQAFLRDHYFGRRRYASEGIISAANLERIIERNGDRGARRWLRPETLQFWYAPDIIRDPYGRFRVLEDNVGLVGGIGDLGALLPAARALGGPAGLLARQAAPDDFYRRIERLYRKEAHHFGPGVVALLSYPRALCDTREDSRFERMLEATGIRALRLRGEASGPWPELMARADRLELREPLHGPGAGNAKEVSFALLNIDHADIEPGHPLTRRRFAELRVPGQDRIGVPGFWRLVRRGRLGTNMAPGIEFVNDKEFYGVIDELIRLYLREEPWLPSIETWSLGGRAGASRHAATFADLESWVIKGVGGRGGVEVWLGPRLSGRERAALRRRVARAPARYVAQRFTPLSTVLGHHVDLRLHAVIGAREIVVSRSPWGRAGPAEGNGKVNVSDAGLLNIVLVDGF